jgi:hypothetical protein
VIKHGLSARTCERCGKPKGVFSYAYHNGEGWTRGYFHLDCFNKMKETIS